MGELAFVEGHLWWSEFREELLGAGTEHVDGRVHGRHVTHLHAAVLGEVLAQPGEAPDLLRRRTDDEVPGGRSKQFAFGAARIVVWVQQALCFGRSKHCALGAASILL